MRFQHDSEMAVNIRKLITMDLVQTALPSNQTYGTAIYNRGGVEIARQTSDSIEGWAGGLDGTIRGGAGQRRRVTFTLEEGRLRWHCTGNPKTHQIFCKHCVAVALALLHAEPAGSGKE